MSRSRDIRTPVSRMVGLIAIFVIAAVAGCGGQTPSSEQKAPEQKVYEAGGILSSETVSEGVPAEADSVRRITYVSRSGIDDSMTHVTGSVYVPRTAAPPGGFHVVAYAPPVSGQTMDCGRSPATASMSGAAIAGLLRAGYVVTVPDYQGLGSPSDGKRLYHPFLDSTTAGYNLMDAVRAAKELVPDTSPIWAAVGEVQGGQASWALNELADNYGFQSLRGTVSIAPTADLDRLADAAAEGTLTPEQQRLYMNYLAALASEYNSSQFRLDDYRRGAVKQHWDLLLSCRPEDEAARAAVSAQINPDDLRPASPEALATLRTFLQKTTLPQGPAQQPMLVVYGEQDPLTPAAWTERAVVRACQMNDQINVRKQPVPALDAEAMDWIAARLQEQPIISDCPAFVAEHPLPEQVPSPAPPDPAAVPAPPPASPASPALPAAAPAETAANAPPTSNSVSLISGWLPAAIQTIAGLALIAATGWRTRRWRLRWVPVGMAVGVASIGAVWWFVSTQGLGSVYPWGMWVWIGLTGLAAAVLVLGWRGSPWWRRVTAFLAVPLCVLSAATVLNASLGYLPTVSTAWQRATGELPPQWIDQTKLAEMRRDGVLPPRGTIVRITTPSDISGFTHREEFVYLPPVWFTSNPPPKLPVIMMLGAELSSPADWLQSGHALEILDAFALQHRGTTPVVVFPDTSGSFTNDTECVNGLRGNAADHLIKEFVPYVKSNFGVSDSASNWGLVGWSSGGTCSLMLSVTNPEIFSAFVSLDGQLGPNAGKKNQTIARLFGGDAEAWAAFDPRTVIEQRGYFYNLAAWVGVSDDVPTVHRAAGEGSAQAESLKDWDTYSEDHHKTANQLCELLSAHGVECSVVGYRGGHDFPSAANGFKNALPWLASRLGTPDVPATALPGA
ncbi:MAG TPA: alpha/beta hydrolase-fold protein [Mycobacterium sp.]|nr:alpha/beta hydrolase-fold protein [Mycobacterium sp.]